MGSDLKKIGFAPNVLSKDPQRFGILAFEEGNFAVIDKPAEVLFDAYAGAPRAKSVIQAMRENPEKPEFKALGFASPFAVNQLDFEISGCGIIAANAEVSSSLRNQMWSGDMLFTYLVLCRKKEAGSRTSTPEFATDLPLVKHKERNVWVVSHRFGKKAHTKFRLLEETDSCELWEASTHSARPHQIRVHAAERDLKIYAETIYSRIPPMLVSKFAKKPFKLGFDEKERPPYPHLAIHLAKAEFAFSGRKIAAVAPLPKGFAVCIKRAGFKFDPAFRQYPDA